jgi:hypothetical protein
MDDANRQFDDFLRGAARLAATPVDVRLEQDASNLDDHIWLRVGQLVENGKPVASLPEDLRAYFVTRFFEYEFDSGGPTGFLDWDGAELARFVAPGYRHLGLSAAATAFERLWASPLMQALVADPEAEAAHDDLWELRRAVGSNNKARVNFIRSHPDTFSI